MCAAVYRWRHLAKATKVDAGLAESNGRLLLGIWRDSLHVTCGLTASTPGSAPGPTLSNEYGKTLPFHSLLVSYYATTLEGGALSDTATRSVRLSICYLSVCLSHGAAAWAISTLAACSLVTADHQRCGDCGPARGRT